MQTEVNTEFIACGCSATPHSLDWSSSSFNGSDDDLIAFGSSQNVCLIKPENETGASQIVSTFCGHSRNVTCVKFVKSTANSRSGFAFLLSGSTDNSAVLWQQQKQSGNFYIEPISKLTGHSMAIEYVCGLYVQNWRKIYVATCSADSLLKIWIIKADDDDSKEIKEKQTIDYGRGFALCADFCYVSQGGMMLAVGNDDNKIRVYYQNEDTDSVKFEEVTVVSGHEDWIRGLSFSSTVLCGMVCLGSCSQDKYARVWSFKCSLNSRNKYECADNGDLQLRPHLFNIKRGKGDSIDDLCCEITLETVLSGHDSWIYSINWHKNSRQLVTASIDKSVIIWEPEASTDIWFAKVQLGEIGGPVAGFYGAVFSPDGTSIVAHSFLGGLHYWKLTAEGTWKAKVFPTGHFNSVEDVAWDPRGNYFLSCSEDQSTRLYALWKRESVKPTYHEISRPQMHGHDMKCLAIINSFCFVSGAEEKILRAFVVPHIFTEHLGKFCGLNDLQNNKVSSRYGHIEGAIVPALGLSNKAVFIEDLDSTANGNRNNEEVDAESNEKYPLLSFQKTNLSEPPTEDFLLQNTLWPEIHKLYGHGFELFCVTSNQSGTIIASACKASKPDHARVIVWSTDDWQQKCQLDGHSLTVTQLEFSPDDRYLLTVSRDRTWFLYSRQENDFSWKKLANTDKKTCVHARIIWTCAWSHDSKYFLTASRDKKLVIWNLADILDTKLSEAACVLDTTDSTTALACAPNFLANKEYLIAYGLENGEICLCTWNSCTKSFNHLQHLNRNVAHSLTVKRLRFKPRTGEGKCENGTTTTVDDSYYLLSCSADHCVKLFNVKLKS